MLRKSLILTPLLALLALACLSPQAKAGIYELHMCNGVNSGVSPLNETWWSGSWSQQQNRANCNYGASGQGPWKLSWSSKADIPNLTFGSSGGYGGAVSAPAGTSFTWVRLSSNILAQGGGYRCTGAFRSNGSIIDGSQNCLGPSYGPQSSGDQTRVAAAVNSDRVSILAFCTFGPCNGGDSNVFHANIWNIVLTVQDNTNPSLSSGSGLWSKDGWVRGSWPAGFVADDGMGIKYSRAALNDKTAAEAGHCNIAQGINGNFYGGSVVPCPGSVRSDFNVDTTKEADGKVKLSLQASDATSNGASADKTILVDNSAPSVNNLTGVGQTTDTTPTITIDANDPQSGISGYLCKVGSGSYASCDKQFTTGALALGEHNICVKAINNASDSNGNLNQSPEFCRSVTIVQASGQSAKPSSSKPSSSKPSSNPSSSNQDDNQDANITVKRTRQLSSANTTVVRSLVSVSKSGVITQTLVNKYGKSLTRCSVSKEAAAAGDYLLDCRLNRATHRQLKKRGMTVYLRTTLFADDNQTSRISDTLNLTKRR